MLNDRITKAEIKQAATEFTLAVHLMMASAELINKGAGEMVLDVLLEELEGLRPKGSLLQSPAVTASSSEVALAEQQIKKAMLSQPMAGKNDEEIKAVREKAVAALEAKGYTVVNTLFTDEWYSKEAMESRGVVQIPLCYLAKSLENMSVCHTAYFCEGWENARGCRIEHEAAKAYGLEIIYEEDPAYEKE